MISLFILFALFTAFSQVFGSQQQNVVLPKTVSLVQNDDNIITIVDIYNNTLLEITVPLELVATLAGNSSSDPLLNLYFANSSSIPTTKGILYPPLPISIVPANSPAIFTDPISISYFNSSFVKPLTGYCLAIVSNGDWVCQDNNIQYISASTVSALAYGPGVYALKDLDPSVPATCNSYLGFSYAEIQYEMLLYTNQKIMTAIVDVLSNLMKMESALKNVYDPNSNRLELTDYIDAIHAFCAGNKCSSDDCATGKCSKEVCKVPGPPACVSLSEFSFLQSAFVGAIAAMHPTPDPCLPVFSQP